MKFEFAGVAVELDGVSDDDYVRVRSHLDANLKTDMKARNAIADAFLFAVRRCPQANPSDLWHHVIYRRFFEATLEMRPGTNPGQSWVRAGGEALEVFVGDYYNPILQPHDLRIRPLIGREKKRQALLAMECHEVVGDAKLDTVLEGNIEGEWHIFGGAHIKASLAERVSDDVPTSVQMMQRGFFSPLWTLDAKSFPPPHGDLVNRGELGSPTKPSEKRKYVELHGSFDNCYSYNLRTIPSEAETPSGKRIYTLSMNGVIDQFVQDCLARWTAVQARKA